MGKITLGLCEQFIKASLGIRLHDPDRNAFPSQAWFGDRNEQTLRRRSIIREIGKPPIHQISAGEGEAREAGTAEPFSDPTRARTTPGDPTTLGGTDPSGAATASFATVASESLPDLDGELHILIICLGGKHCNTKQ